MKDTKQIVLGLVVVAVLVGVGVWLWLPQSGPMAVPVKAANVPYIGGADVFFKYPNKYVLYQRTDSFETNSVWVLTLVDPKVQVPDMSDGPAGMSILEVANPTNIPLDQWVKQKSISNFNLQSEPTLASTTVAGEPAVTYQHSGLFETKVVAVAHNGRVYLFSVDSIDPNSQMSAEFKQLIDSVVLK